MRAAFLGSDAGEGVLAARTLWPGAGREGVIPRCPAHPWGIALCAVNISQRNREQWMGRALFLAAFLLLWTTTHPFPRAPQPLRVGVHPWGFSGAAPCTWGPPLLSLLPGVAGSDPAAARRNPFGVGGGCFGVWERARSACFSGERD